MTFNIEAMRSTYIAILTIGKIMTFDLENLRISPYYPKEIIEAWDGQKEFDLIPSVKWESIQHPLYASKIWDGRAIAPLKGSDVPFLLFSTHSEQRIINNTLLIYSLEHSLSLDQWHWKDNWREGILDAAGCEFIFRLFRREPCDIKPLKDIRSDETNYTTIWSEEI